MTAPPGSAGPSPKPQQCRERRLALGLSIDQAARRTGLSAEALQRFEQGDGGLTEGQFDALVRALGTPTPAEARQAPRPMLDLGLVGAVLFLVGGAFPAAMVLVSGVDALRFLDAEWVEAEVVGFEPRVRIVERERGPTERVPTLAPLLRYSLSGSGDEVTIPWRDAPAGQVEFAAGEHVRLLVPRSAPMRAERDVADLLIRPVAAALLAAPLLLIGAASLRHWRRRRRGEG